MVSYEVFKNYEEFDVNGTKVAVIKLPNGKVRLQVHVSKGSQQSYRMTKEEVDMRWYTRHRQ